MPRALPLGFMAALTAQGARTLFCVQLFADDHPAPIRVWTGDGELQTDHADGTARSWAGGSSLLGIGGAAEQSDLAATSMQIRFGVLDHRMLHLAVTDGYRGQPASVHFGVMTDPVTPRAAADLLWDGTMSVASLDADGATETLTIRVEHPIARLQRVAASRYTAEWQRSQHPDDAGLDWVNAAQTQKIVWGPGEGGTRALGGG